MTIEMSRPEEVLQEELWGMANGTVPLPTVKEARVILHEKVKNMEPIAPADIEKVNTPFRRELMKKKTNELVEYVATHNPNPNDAELQMMLDMFDYLAMDWVYSDALMWDNTLVSAYAKKIRDRVVLKTL